MSLKEQRLNFITKISKKRRWDFGDGNPYFVEVYELMDKIQATTLKEYKRKLKLERKKYEENAMHNYIATSLCV